ncbi:maleylpyruvate isomerase family mycothiol-dependent enzyme [Streptomyces wuyuanensis]|uniref:maleylpyruvate isomerase family mycothiol-dependent enzyme n=1 Tax=Streptomyces wuyuanensis TaxID=1196353 RepID=UPI0034349774
MSTADVHGLIDEVVRSGSRLSEAVAGRTDAEFRAPSRLEGWTRGRVLAHVAHAADAYVWLLRRARTGVEPGPRRDGAALAQATEDTAALPAVELLAEVRGCLARFTAEAQAMPAEAWTGMVRALAGWRHPAWFTLRRCLRELETHHLDLGLGYRTADWPAAYVSWALDDTLAALKAQGFAVSSVEAVDLGRSWEVCTDGPAIAGPGHALLGWLSGRTSAVGLVSDHPSTALPCPPAWPQPPVPGWGMARDGGSALNQIA